MTTREIAGKLLAGLRRMPHATPAEALAEFRRRLVEVRLAKRKTR
ncbi:hypothetical protein [Reyranella soli]|uniref:Uncharacterized protein n=1 Tax=Reyranella soli TaxID=1230389 RepID=A0A512NNB5_9HYPH|nr:hypothetical protein [Reyranella soli]GEP60441.1 hypothetical protein RSO01_76070 [Reyranella soli]